MLLKKDGDFISPSSYLEYRTSYSELPASKAKHYFRHLRVKNQASHTKLYSLKFKAGPLYSNDTATFRVLPRGLQVQQNRMWNVGFLSHTSYVSGSSLGSYTASLLSDRWQQITDVFPSDGFQVSAFLVTGANGDSTSLPNCDDKHSSCNSYNRRLTSYTRLAPEDLLVYDSASGSEVLKLDDILNTSSTNGSIHFCGHAQMHLCLVSSLCAVC